MNLFNKVVAIKYPVCICHLSANTSRCLLYVRNDDSCGQSQKNGGHAITGQRVKNANQLRFPNVLINKVVLFQNKAGGPRR